MFRWATEGVLPQIQGIEVRDEILYLLAELLRKTSGIVLPFRPYMQRAEHGAEIGIPEVSFDCSFHIQLYNY
jgi:hypothetical protein